MGHRVIIMDASFTEDQLLIRETVASFLADWKKAGGYRALIDSSLKFDRDVWRKFAVDLGFSGLTVPIHLGGSGLGAIERVLVAEEMGKVLFMSPYFATCVMATDLLQTIGGKVADQYLAQIAKGLRTATVTKIDTFAISNTFSGKAENVIDGENSDVILVVAGDKLIAIDAKDKGTSVGSVKTMDQTRSLADIYFENTKYTMVSTDTNLTNKIETARANSAITLASEQVGGAEALLGMTVSYIKERKQFGRVIGSFQALKHRCADMMMVIEEARSAVYLAAAKSKTDEMMEYAAIAKSVASETFFKVAGDSIQLHGGVGVTWEYDLHFYFKRARAGLSLLGTPEYWREKIAESIEHYGVEK